MPGRWGGADAGRVCAVFGGSAEVAVDEVQDIVSARRAGRIVERQSGSSDVHGAGGVRRQLEGAGPAVAEEHLVSHGRAVAGVPGGAALKIPSVVEMDSMWNNGVEVEP